MDENINNISLESITPKEYFEKLKNSKVVINDEELTRILDNAIHLMKKSEITGQKLAQTKLAFHVKSIIKEREIIKLGINTFIYRDDIEFYIENVKDSVVKIIELENYEREIPDDVINAISLVKDKFDVLYVLFTDYTGESERQVEKARREKDPIIFGAFKNESNGALIERFYFIADWEDEFCDLTLNKLVNDLQLTTKSNVTRLIHTPESLEELQAQVKNISGNSYSNITLNSVDGTMGLLTSTQLNVSQPKAKTGFFKNITTAVKNIFGK